MARDITIAHGEWLAACDGRKFLLMRNDGTADRPALTVEDEAARTDAPDRELSTDRPGRMDSPGRGPRSAFEETDFHDLEEADFAKRIAVRLGEMVDAGRIGSLVLAAAPRTLGAMRPHYSPALAKAIRQELDADLTPLPVAEIEKRLAR